MRTIDRNRLIAMKEIRVKANTLVALVNEYERTYNDKVYSTQDIMDILDETWRLITENQIRLTEVLRENGK